MAADSKPGMVTIVAQVVTADIDSCLIATRRRNGHEKKDKGIYSD